MKVAIIGAGASGLAAARALMAVDVDVTVYEASMDVGGVWSAYRSYPGLGLQSDKRSYSFSDSPMPDDYPEYPTGAQVLRYFEAFARDQGLDEHIRLQSRVVRAELDADGGWELDVSTPEGPITSHADWLVVANGLNSRSHVPALPGRAEFERAGGAVLTPSELGDGSVLHGRRVAVIGYGKSAADIVLASSRVAASTDMIVRAIAWKLPRRVGRIRFQHLLLTRGGEFLLWAPYRSIAGRAARVATKPFRGAFARRLEQRIRTEWQLERRGVAPSSTIDTLTHLTTEGFFEALDRGEAQLRAGVSITRLGVIDGRPTVELSDGTTLHADLVVAATGYDQDVEFLGPRARRALLGDAEELVLQRHMLPTTLGRIAFVGWAQSFRSPLGAELQSLWLAAHIRGLTGRGRKRTAAGPRLTTYRLTHEAAERRGVALVATGSGFQDLDEWIEEAGFRLPLRERVRQWFRPLHPEVYADLLPQLRRRFLETRPDTPSTTGDELDERPSTQAFGTRA